jgi:hypothetical protein
VNFLLEIDKLVQLLESPIFTCIHEIDYVLSFNGEPYFKQI